MSQMLFHREAGVNFLLMDMVDLWVHASRAVRMWKSGEKFYFGLDCGYLKDQICSNSFDKKDPPAKKKKEQEPQRISFVLN